MQDAAAAAAAAAVKKQTAEALPLLAGKVFVILGVEA
jgi:hypothetical protein